MRNCSRGLSRRGFVKTTVVSVGSLSVGGLLGVGAAHAEDVPKVDENDATAKALKYVHDAGQVDAGTRGGDDRFCDNCQFYTGDPSSEWGPCTLFPGKSVNAKGWCSAWAKKAG